MAFTGEFYMDLLNDKISKLYFKFLSAAFGSALVTSIYGVVDMAMVGQYHGPSGSAAMGVIAPIWNIIYSFGLLVGIGGSVIYSFAKGESRSDSNPNKYFTASVIFGISISLILWIGIYAAEDSMLRLFGANDDLLPLCRRYLVPVKLTVPVYIFTQIFAAFLRNDSNPGLATKAVLIGGVFNVFGDYFLVFTMDMGIMGAGIATAMGASASLIIMATHFISKKNTLRFTKVDSIFKIFGKISVSGFSTFIIDIAMGVLTMLFNRQIMKYLDTNALAIYAVIVNISTFVQCCAYGVGQACQPIISQNFGAKKVGRINSLLKYSLASTAILGIIWTAAACLIPNGFIKLFMTPTEEILSLAPSIIRTYAVSFILLPLNVYSTFYFQAILKPNISSFVSITRGIVLSGALIMLLPAIFGGESIWLAMPITEAIIAVFVIFSMRAKQKEMKARFAMPD